MAYSQTAADALSELGRLQARADMALVDLEVAHPAVERGLLRTHYPGCWADRRHGDCLAVRMRRILTGAHLPELPELTGKDADHDR